MLQNLSSAAVVIDTLRVKVHKWMREQMTIIVNSRKMASLLTVSAWSKMTSLPKPTLISRGGYFLTEPSVKPGNDRAC